MVRFFKRHYIDGRGGHIDATFWLCLAVLAGAAVLFVAQVAIVSGVTN
jgi:hypothetical protein